MAEATEPGNGSIPLNDETEVLDELLQETSQPVLENEIVPETQIAHPSTGDGSLVAPTQPEVVIAGGNYVGAVIGPQTNKIVRKANDYRNANITNIHHHYPANDGSQESPSTSNATGARPKQSQKPASQEEVVKISDDLFMYRNQPLQEGTDVYKGYQLHASGDRRPLAIKRIVPCEDSHLREVQHLLALASHPNVVQIIQSKAHDGFVRVLFIAMELCSSHNLQDYLDRNREKNAPFDFDQTMSFTVQLVSGMKHIHVNKIVHRDLKPENILVSEDGQHIKVSDFGLSKRLRLGKSQTRQTKLGVGTDGYRAPETFKSETIGSSADIFSLGATIYSIWSNGNHPFGEDADLWNYKIKNNKGRDLSGLLISGIKKNQLRSLIDSMLHPDPKKRPTIEQVAQHPFFISGPSSTAEDPNNRSHLRQLPVEKLSPKPKGSGDKKTLSESFQSASSQSASASANVDSEEGIVIFDRNSDHLQLFNPAHNTLKKTQSFYEAMRVESFTVLTLHDFVYVLMTTKSVLRLKYSDEGATWERMTDMIDDHGSWPPATVMSGCIYVAGGGYSSGTNAVEKFDPSSDEWSSLENKNLVTRNNALVVAQGSIYSIGGWSENQVERFDLVSSTWTFVAPTEQVRTDPAAVEFNGKIFVLGGGSGAVSRLSSVEIYDPSTNVWSVMKINMLKPRSGFGAFVINGDIYAVGGDVERESIERYSSERDIWEEVQIQTKSMIYIGKSTKILI